MSKETPVRNVRKTMTFAGAIKEQPRDREDVIAEGDRDLLMRMSRIESNQEEMLLILKDIRRGLSTAPSAPVAGVQEVAAFQSGRFPLPGPGQNMSFKSV